MSVAKKVSATTSCFYQSDLQSDHCARNPASAFHAANYCAKKGAGSKEVFRCRFLTVICHLSARLFTSNFLRLLILAFSATARISTLPLLLSPVQAAA